MSLFYRQGVTNVLTLNIDCRNLRAKSGGTMSGDIDLSPRLEGLRRLSHWYAAGGPPPPLPHGIQVTWRRVLHRRVLTEGKLQRRRLDTSRILLPTPGLIPSQLPKYAYDQQQVENRGYMRVLKPDTFKHFITHLFSPICNHKRLSLEMWPTHG